jgi:hypothetical protein
MMGLVSEQICQMRFERRIVERPITSSFDSNDKKVETNILNNYDSIGLTIYSYISQRKLA